MSSSLRDPATPPATPVDHEMVEVLSGIGSWDGDIPSIDAFTLELPRRR